MRLTLPTTKLGGICRERLGGSCNTTPVRPQEFFDPTGCEPCPPPIEKINAKLWMISPFHRTSLS